MDKTASPDPAADPRVEEAMQEIVRHAVHESRHAVVAYYVGATIQTISIEPHAEPGGRRPVLFSPVPSSR